MLPFRPYDPTDVIVLKVFTLNKNVVYCPGQASVEESSENPLDSRLRPCLLQEKTIHHVKNRSWSVKEP